MTKDVMISIRGMQFEGAADADNIEVIQRGRYYRRNGMHYLVYDEPVEGTGQINKNMLKFNEKELHVSKKGAVNVSMSFREKEKNMTDYRTPYGSIMIGIDTQQVGMKESEQGIQLAVDYSLDVNYEFLSKCKIRIEAQPI
ncbi:MAG: DUF1934 domain-containing protein [Lachnospiraceae bacterium]|nr:DUF1934 domain-containing protein [Lachnospiraceae bacterium]